MKIIFQDFQCLIIFKMYVMKKFIQRLVFLRCPKLGIFLQNLPEKVLVEGKNLQRRTETYPKALEITSYL